VTSTTSTIGAPGPAPNPGPGPHQAAHHPALLTMPAVLGFLRAHRAGADVPPEYLANLGPRARERAVSTRGLSQALIAAMVGIDVRTYRDFERQGVSGAAVIRAVAGILGVSRPQHAAMWRWTRRLVPPELRPPVGRVDPAFAELVTGTTPAPAVWLTPEWDVIASNQPAAEHLGLLARTGVNWATAILGPRGEARGVVADWPGCARWMVAALRMATVDPDRTHRTAEVVCEVRQHQPTAQLWDSSADMREGPDGMILRAVLPSTARPVDLRLSALHRGDNRLVVLRPAGPPTGTPTPPTLPGTR